MTFKIDDNCNHTILKTHPLLLFVFEIEYNSVNKMFEHRQIQDMKVVSHKVVKWSHQK